LPSIDAAQLLNLLAIGVPTHHRGLSVFPLTPKRSIAAPAHLVLDDALATGGFRITDVSLAGAVPAS
jgi:hypothetical protein